MHMRAALLPILATVIGCARGGSGNMPYRLTPADRYEVGEDATIVLDAKKLSDDDAKVVITRPDGSILKEQVALDQPNSRIRFGRPPPHPGLPPTFTTTGAYRIELKVDDTVLAKTEVTIERNRLDELLPTDDIADYKQITRYTRPKIYGKTYQGKSYGAIYSPPSKVEARVEITIDDPGKHLAATWKTFEEEGAPSVIEESNVIFRERGESVTASWRSDKVIVRMQAPTLADLERGIIGHFLKRFPSKLGAK
jgi:hypothetical protein